MLAKGRHWPLNNLVLRSDGKGHFTTAVLGDAPDRTYTAALADLDGDGHLDIVVSNDRPDRKLIYLNDGKPPLPSLRHTKLGRGLAGFELRLATMTSGRRSPFRSATVT